MFRFLIFLVLLLAVGCARSPVSDQFLASDADRPPAAPALAPLPAESEGSTGPPVATKAKLGETRFDPTLSEVEETAGVANTAPVSPAAPPEVAARSAQLESDPSGSVTVPMFGTVVERADPVARAAAAQIEPVAEPVAGDSALEAVPPEPQIPLFTLPSADGRTIALESYLGEKNVVLVFYRGFW